MIGLTRLGPFLLGAFALSVAPAALAADPAAALCDAAGQVVASGSAFFEGLRGEQLDEGHWQAKTKDRCIIARRDNAYALRCDIPEPTKAEATKFAVDLLNGAGPCLESHGWKPVDFDADDLAVGRLIESMDNYSQWDLTANGATYSVQIYASEDPIGGMGDTGVTKLKYHPN